MNITLAMTPQLPADLGLSAGQAIAAVPKGQTVSSELSVVRHSESSVRMDAVPRTLQKVEGIVDRMRADLDAFRARIAAPQQPVYVNGASPSSGVASLSAAMDSALHSQMQILEIGVAFNAGLSASQQSQSSAKTLLEKA